MRTPKWLENARREEHDEAQAWHAILEARRRLRAEAARCMKMSHAENDAWAQAGDEIMAISARLDAHMDAFRRVLSPGPLKITEQSVMERVADNPAMYAAYTVGRLHAARVDEIERSPYRCRACGVRGGCADTCGKQDMVLADETCKCRPSGWFHDGHGNDLMVIRVPDCPVHGADAQVEQ